MRINSSCLRLPLGNRSALAVLVLVAEFVVNSWDPIPLNKNTILKQTSR
jgi:hypothetical protein